MPAILDFYLTESYAIQKVSLWSEGIIVTSCPLTFPLQTIFSFIIVCCLQVLSRIQWEVEEGFSLSYTIDLAERKVLVRAIN